ncbi:hypothetical protein GCM10020221_15390 [Streptomyces thioluteus]|uniref:Uncharacterized protein n=1 Tax=Streptomyces thioluteus TaxID=66431 RepID=A0ABN3WMD6_STRTU
MLPGEHQGQLAGVGEQGAHRVGDEVEGRAVARDEHEEEGADELVLGEPVAVLPRGDQVAGDVLAGPRPLLGDEAGEQPEQPAAGGDDLVGAGGRCW